MCVRDEEDVDAGRHVPLWCETCHGEECVDHILLAHKYRCEQVCDGHSGDLTGVRPLDAVPDKDADVREEDDSEKPTVQGHHLEANVPQPSILGLVGQLIVLEAFPDGLVLLDVGLLVEGRSRRSV